MPNKSPVAALNSGGHLPLPTFNLHTYVPPFISRQVSRRYNRGSCPNTHKLAPTTSCPPRMRRWAAQGKNAEVQRGPAGKMWLKTNPTSSRFARRTLEAPSRHPPSPLASPRLAKYRDRPGRANVAKAPRRRKRRREDRFATRRHPCRRARSPWTGKPRTGRGAAVRHPAVPGRGPKTGRGPSASTSPWDRASPASGPGWARPTTAARWRRSSRASVSWRRCEASPVPRRRPAPTDRGRCGTRRRHRAQPRRLRCRPTRKPSRAREARKGWPGPNCTPP